jgi:hypothetical protein
MIVAQHVVTLVMLGATPTPARDRPRPTSFLPMPEEPGTRPRSRDGVGRKVQRLGPPGIYDQYGKLAEDALIQALADRRLSSPSDTVGLETLLTALVEQHLVRLAEDGRPPVTLSTYRFAVGKLQKFIGGVRVGEASPARIDAALRSMRSAHGPTMARQAKTVLHGALQLAVMANVLGSNPVRDVQPLRSKTQPRGAVGLTAEQLRDLLQKLQASKFCQITISSIRSRC